ncbi:endonuclease/exonuclease/phosphatase family protein [Pseudomonas hunanensis]|uniref:endonuclease/exonuclease/phosphatase family protein n=1 Tax=Pseudomonas hunanensis TaxID=1247546 RepID=UPI0015B9B9EB|nr:endonuclease/exonuclease/phosphatase family protein [Pseudomonas hunanensis]
MTKLTFGQISKFSNQYGLIMELKCAWWNCKLSPPKNGATRYPISDNFFSIIRAILQKGVDVLGLCEIDRNNIQELQQTLKQGGFSNYTVLDLYSSGRSINDFCLIFNSAQLSLSSEAIDANIHDPHTDQWLKAGIFIGLTPALGEEIFFGLSHWQSRGTYPYGSTERLRLGDALRTKAMAIFDEHPSSPIVLLGDFNDEPFDISIVRGIGASRDLNFVKKFSKYFFNPFWSRLSPQPEGPAGTFVHPRITGSDGAIFDQIIFSSHFVRDWKFKEYATIISDIDLIEVSTQWKDISDHYPILSHVERL